MSVGAVPLDDNGRPVLALWNDATGQIVPVHIGAIVTGADGKPYAKLDVSASVTATNPSVGTDGSAVPVSSTLVGATDGTNLQALLVESAAHPNLRAAIYNGANEWGIDASGKGPIKAASGDFVDGAIVTLGTEADAAWSSGNGTVIALLKAMFSKMLSVQRASVALFTTAQSTVGSANSGDITVGPYTEISIDITTTAQAGTNPTIQFFWDRKGADSVYYPLWQTNVLSAASNTVSASIGAGMAYNQSLGLTGRLRWVVGGTATPTWTFTPNVYGK